jgi:ketosteroid isomerase-like protein
VDGRGLRGERQRVGRGSLNDGAGVEGEVVEVARAWDRAMVTNDPEAIGQFVADEWTIIGPDGRIQDRESFLALIRSGGLTHDEMETLEPRVRIYGEAALLVARGVSGGTWEGRPFRLIERMSCLFVRSDGAWRCVSTHLSLLDDGGNGA